MEILFLTSGRSAPSSRFRVLNYLPYLETRPKTPGESGTFRTGVAIDVDDECLMHGTSSER
jgi:hypothetical protein